MTSDRKFAMFKSKVQKAVEDQDYFSQSVKSDSDEEDGEVAMIEEMFDTGDKDDNSMRVVLRIHPA